MTVNAPKTPGMAVRKAKRKLQKDIVNTINVYSPDMSIAEQPEFTGMIDILFLYLYHDLLIYCLVHSNPIFSSYQDSNCSPNN